jgi:prepilin-type N-terminal cleavage/methylation domain-containing protein
MTNKADQRGFTLAEMLISVAILALLVVFVSHIFSAAASVTTTGQKHVDSDLQARQLFNRMAVDFAQMIKRSDVDSYLKGLDPETGNDRIAFFSQVPGYYPSTGPKSPTSLVAYRINAVSNSASFNKMERMGKGLLWNGASATDKPLIFGPTPTLINNWPSATSGDPTDPNYQDADYELIGPQIFRLEYFYFLKDGTVAVAPSSDGIMGVASISMCIAVVDPKSKVLLSNSQLSTLAGKMNDFSTSMKPGDLVWQWQASVDNTTDMPRTAISAIRFYQRAFHLLPKF